MPIKGLTRREDVLPRFTRLGKVRKGMIVPTSTGKTKPVDLDYLRFVGEGPHARDLEAVWKNSYGEKSTMIFLYLPYAGIEENWTTWQEEWAEKQGLIHRCDGEIMVQWLDPISLTYTRDYDQAQRKPCPYHSGEKQRTDKKPGCQEVGRLAMILPPFLEAGYAGYVTLEIGSVNDLANITASLLDAEGKARAAHRATGLQGIEFCLSRRPETISVRFTGSDGKVTKTTAEKWMLHLDPSREWLQAQIGTMSQLALGNTLRPAIIDVPASELPALPMPEGPEDAPDAAEEAAEEHRQEAILEQDRRDPHPAPVPTATPTPASSQPPHPWDAGQVLTELGMLAAKLVSSDASTAAIESVPARRGVFIKSLEACFQGDATAKMQQRKTVTWWLFGTDEGSSKTLTVAQIRAWRTTYTPDGKNLADYAVQEMNAVHTAAVKDAGQAELPIAEAPTEAASEETVQF